MPRGVSVHNSWKPGIDLELRLLWAEGFTARQIAARLNAEYKTTLTKDAVIGRAHRLQLERRSMGRRFKDYEPPVSVEEEKDEEFKALARETGEEF